MNKVGIIKHLTILTLLTASLSGCMLAPVVGMANLAHKSGTMTVTLEGQRDAIKAFKDAAIKNGGTVPATTTDFARAEFSSVDMKVEIQVTGTQTKIAVVRGSSLSNVGRTYEFKDNIGEITEKVALDMQDGGYVIKSKQRDRGM
ncbi:hypothetical protein [Rhodoferax sp. GW822-FHT02A01]|uniref:hypothetical protein n=1 Tax=Rhodoferax sp. GW822-FHT02A01 TaxID=3141537 RepID=UPI00315DA8D1